MEKINKKYLIAGAAVVAVILIAGFIFSQKSNKAAPLSKLTGKIETISDDKSSITLKTDTVTYTVNMSTVKTLKNSAKEKISINDIKTGDNIELRTRTNLKKGTVTQVDAYSLKNLSISGSQNADDSTKDEETKEVEE